jgi:hypothetical protein
MSKTRLFVLCAVAMGLAFIFPTAVARARVTQISITRVESPTFEGRSFGRVGQYEKLVGLVFGEVDPDDPLNAVITDIGLAPRNAEGKVEYTADFYILKPVHLSRGNGRLLYEVNNRGNKLSIGFLNFFGTTANTNNDPTTSADAGNGFLMRQGYTIAWSGWDITAAPGGNRLTITVPVALSGGDPIVGPALEDFTIDGDTTLTGALTYPAATFDKSQAALTVQVYRSDPPTSVPSTDWEYVDASTIQLLPAGTPFQHGTIYQFVYPAIGPKISTLGFAATRDFVCFLRHAVGDDQRNPNPLAGEIRWTFSFGISQSGRFQRPFLHLGFNEDEEGRRVFDGMLPYINGGGGGFFNYRFAQPGRTDWHRLSHPFPEQIFPFAYPIITDPLTGETDGVLARCTTSGTCPKVFDTNDANSYWFKSASLVITTPDGGSDLDDPPNVRFFLFSSIPHGPASGLGICQQLQNPVVPNAGLRALLVSLAEWVVRGREPPASQVPRLEEGTLVHSLPQSEVGFPDIPGVSYNGVVSIRELADYGPDFDQGIITVVPPVLLGPAYATLVPTTDADGIDVAGIHLPEIGVPLATYTGWNLRADPPNDDCTASGSLIPFATTEAERQATGDPRLSIEERYKNHEGYVRAVARASRRLVHKRFLLEEDAEQYVEEAEASNVLR